MIRQGERCLRNLDNDLPSKGCGGPSLSGASLNISSVEPPVTFPNKMLGFILIGNVISATNAGVLMGYTHSIQDPIQG